MGNSPGLDGASSSSIDTRVTLSSSSSSESMDDNSVVVSVKGDFEAAPAYSTAAASAGSTDAPAGATSTSAAAAAASRTLRWKLVNYVLIPISLPLLAVYWVVALLLGLLASFMVWPSLLLAQRLYWACPFIPYIWRSPAIRNKFGVLGSWLLRLQFEGAYCTTVVSRLLTLPLRPHLPDFYLLGFPVSDTRVAQLHRGLLLEPHQRVLAAVGSHKAPLLVQHPAWSPGHKALQAALLVTITSCAAHLRHQMLRQHSQHPPTLSPCCFLSYRSVAPPAWLPT